MLTPGQEAGHLSVLKQVAIHIIHAFLQSSWTCPWDAFSNTSAEMTTLP